MSSLVEFESMPLAEKGITLLDKGNLINMRTEKEHKVFLFELKGNLVEVFFLPSNKKIELIKVLDMKDAQTLKERKLYFATS